MTRQVVVAGVALILLAMVIVSGVDARHITADISNDAA